VGCKRRGKKTNPTKKKGEKVVTIGTFIRDVESPEKDKAKHLDFKEMTKYLKSNRRPFGVFKKKDWSAKRAM